jgi:membrane associated rhomboid family serine protease
VFPLKDNIPTDRLAVVTIAFIAINVIVYFLLQKGGIFSGPDDAIVVDWGAIPYEFSHPGKECGIAAQQIACEGMRGVSGEAARQPAFWVTAFSSMFMHGGILHLAGNMLFLWIFGNNVEDAMGPVKFVGFYLLGGLAAIAAQIAIEPNAAVPTIGASGAVAAVLGGYILLYPRARVVTVIFIIFFFTIVELPALLILGFWFLQQVAFGAYGLANPTGGGGGVAYFAHIGGFAFGLLAIKLFASRTKDYTVPPKYPVY